MRWIFERLLFLLVAFLETSKAFAVSDQSKTMDCLLVLRGMADGSLWQGATDFVVIPPEGKTMKVARISRDELAFEGSHFKVMYSTGELFYPPVFVSVNHSPRQEGKPGFAYRMVAYSVFDPRAMSEFFSVLEHPQERVAESLSLILEPSDPEQMQSVLDLGSSLMNLIPNRVSPKFVLAKMPVYGKDSARSANDWALARSEIFTRYIERPREIDIEKFASESSATAEQMRLLTEGRKMFRDLHTTAEVRKGTFGDYSEHWFAAKVELDKGKISIQREILTHVVRVGPMSYVNIFAADTSSPLSGLAQKIRRSHQ